MPDKEIRAASLEYHRQFPPGKISIQPTKHLTNQRDLALAYTPGVAAACDEIVRDPGRGAQPDRARQPGRRRHQRHGRAGAGRDRSARRQAGHGRARPSCSRSSPASTASTSRSTSATRTSWSTSSPRSSRRSAASISRTSRRRNASTSRSKLRERLKIPVFHDDQHGTAIIVGAAITNGLRVVGKELKDVKLVCSGAGAAALACLDLLVLLGIPQQNIWVADIAGVVYRGRREEMDDNKARYAQPTEAPQARRHPRPAPTSFSASRRRRC